VRKWIVDIDPNRGNISVRPSLLFFRWRIFSVPSPKAFFHHRRRRRSPPLFLNRLSRGPARHPPIPLFVFFLFVFGPKTGGGGLGPFFLGSAKKARITVTMTKNCLWQLPFSDLLGRLSPTAHPSLLDAAALPATRVEGSCPFSLLFLCSRMT